MLHFSLAALAFHGPAAPMVQSARAGPVVAAAPELFVYDHCPFCVRVRVAAGVLGVEHKLVFMGNDDVETPTAMVGKKIAPIWKDEDFEKPSRLCIPVGEEETTKCAAWRTGRLCSEL